MKANVLFALLILGLVIPVGAMSQDLDRVNNLVNQALEMAEGARNVGSTAQIQQQDRIHNPFAQRTEGLGVQAANGTRVGVDSDRIRINAGGQQFQIPRISSGPAYQTPDSVDPHMAGQTRPHRYGTGRLTNIGAPGSQVSATYGPYLEYSNAVVAFRGGDYRKADQLMDRVPADAIPVGNQFRALCKFSQGNFPRSAEFAYATLGRVSAWEWRQLRSYYKASDDYRVQYLALQDAVRQPTCDVSTQFLLGYHHLMLGHRSHAIKMFDLVLAKLPNDPVVTRLVRIAHDAPPAPRSN